jgi:lipoate-protein ligase A
VLGCSQRTLRAAVQQRLEGRAELLTRESGGGAVLTGPWLLGASVVLPLRHAWLAGSLLESYRHLGQLHVAALATFGIPARALSPQEMPRVRQAIGVRAVDWACFGSLSPWEVVSADGRKLVGLAQRRQKSGVLLVSGTLLDAPDWKLLCDAMGQAQDENILRQRTASCSELAQQPISADQFSDVLTQELGHSLT